MWRSIPFPELGKGLMDKSFVCMDGWGEDARVVDSAVVRDGKFHMGRNSRGKKG